MSHEQPGALLDTRTDDQKKGDFLFNEIVASVALVNWVEKPQSEWRKFPIFNQNGSGSCVAQTLRKIMGVYIWLKTGVFVTLSASHIYQRRVNKPASGMSGVDAFEIGKKGVTLEQFAPSENMSDMQMDLVQVLPFMEKVGEVFKLGNFVVVPIKDIETVASIIQTTGKAVMVWFFFQRDEWGNVPVINNPSLDLNASNTLRHSLAAVDSTMYQGQKALIIDESWGQDTAMNGQRVITESFFKERNFFVGYFTNFAFEEGNITKPYYKFKKVLEFGMTDIDVRELQTVLQYEGMFPSSVTPTSYYGSISSKGVLAFQKKYQVAPDNELEQLQGKRVGTRTLQKLNELYGS